MYDYLVPNILNRNLNFSNNIECLLFILLHVCTLVICQPRRIGERREWINIRYCDVYRIWTLHFIFCFPLEKKPHTRYLKMSRFKEWFQRTYCNIRSPWATYDKEGRTIRDEISVSELMYKLDLNFVLL